MDHNLYTCSRKKKRRRGKNFSPCQCRQFSRKFGNVFDVVDFAVPVVMESESGPAQFLNQFRIRIQLNRIPPTKMTLFQL